MGRVLVRQTKDMYAENVQYLSSSAFTFEFEHGFCASQLPLDFEQGCFTVVAYPMVYLSIVANYLYFSDNNQRGPKY